MLSTRKDSMTELDAMKRLCHNYFSALNWLVTACDGMETIYTRSTIRKQFFDIALSGGRDLINEVQLNGGIDATIKSDTRTNSNDKGSQSRDQGSQRDTNSSS